MSETPIIDLQKQEIRVPGLSGKTLSVCLTLRRGELCLVRGANGAGKSTFLKWLFANLKSLNLSTATTRYLSQGADEDFILPNQLLDVARGMCAEKTLLVSDVFFPESLWQVPWNKASLGERQRALLSGVMSGRPELLLLDEPTSALDSQAESLFWHELEKLCSSGTSVVVVYHGGTKELPRHKELFL